MTARVIVHADGAVYVETTRRRRFRRPVVTDQPDELELFVSA